MEINPKKIEAWCEVCRKEIFEFSSWEEHMRTQEHLDNAIKFVLMDSGAKTIEEIPEKIDDYINSISKELPDELRD